MDRFWIKLVTPSSHPPPSWIFYGCELFIGSGNNVHLQLDDGNMDSKEVHFYLMDDEILARRTGGRGSLIISGNHLKKGEIVSLSSPFTIIKDKRIFEVYHYSSEQNLHETLVVAKSQTTKSRFLKISQKNKLSSGDYLRGITLPNDGVVTIGRSDDCHITLDDPLISRYHANIIINNETVTVEDLNTKNGTFIASKRVNRRETWRDGSSVDMGNWSLKCRPQVNDKQIY